MTPAALSRGRCRVPVLLAVIVGLTLLAYAPSVGGGFVHDDLDTVRDNPHLRDLGNVGRFFSDPDAFSVRPASQHTRPLLLTSFAINFEISDAAWTFKLTNLLLHCLNVVLLGLLVRRLCRAAGRQRDAGWAAVIAAAVFALHPINTQAVAYVSSRSALLAFTCYVGALIAFVSMRTRMRSGLAVRTRTLAAFVLLQAAALLTKEHTVSLVGAIALLELVLFQERGKPVDRRGLLAALAPPIALVGLYLVYRQIVIDPSAGASQPMTFLHATTVEGSYVWHLATQIAALPVYVGLFLWPVDVALQHPVAPVHSLTDPVFLLAFAALLATLGWALHRWWRHRSLVATGVLLSLCCLAPEALVRLNMAVNEHRLYLPMVGLGLALALLALRGYDRLADRHAAAGRGLIVAGLAALLLLGWKSHDYAATWKTECSLWAHTVSASPDDSWAHNNHGNCLSDAGEIAAAEGEYRRALALAPDNTLALYNLSVAVEQQGRYEEALSLLTRFDAATGGEHRSMYATRLRRLQWRVENRPR